MIIDFTVKNFRSFKEETLLSLEASAGKSKPDNVAKITTKNGKKFRLLKTAVIYGANASGKSNIMKAFWAFRQLISSSFRYDINDEIPLAEPFELDDESSKGPTEFKLNFIAWDRQQYIYFVSLSRTEGIIEESLKYYPQTQAKLIFKRKNREVSFQNPDFFPDNHEKKKINPKRLLLSELGNNGDEYWEDIRNYFVLGTQALNGSTRGMMASMSNSAKRLFEQTDPKLTYIRDQVVRLVQVSDLGIKGLDIVEEEISVKGQEDSDEDFSSKRKVKRFKTNHNVYQNKTVIGSKQFDLLTQGSVGTNALVGLSAELLIALNTSTGKPIWIDEIDNSLHPYLCRFLINLFNHPKSNPFHSQLIFATHETTLLDRNNFRKDQIWISSKDVFGCSKIYSVYDLDIDGLRDDIPFDKWYMSGKFGGLPKIKEMDFIFDREPKDNNG